MFVVESWEVSGVYLPPGEIPFLLDLAWALGIVGSFGRGGCWWMDADCVRREFGSSQSLGEVALSQDSVYARCKCCAEVAEAMNEVPRE